MSGEVGRKHWEPDMTGADGSGLSSGPVPARVRCRDDWHPYKPGNPLIVTDEACIMRDMTPEEAEQMLAEWVTVTRSRDERVRAAVAAGLSKHRVHVLTGIGRSTIDRVLQIPAAHGAPAEGRGA